MLLIVAPVDKKNPDKIIAFFFVFGRDENCIQKFWLGSQKGRNWT
jgi:hypothetical protein